MRVTFKPKDALLVVDPQNDFLPGGSLAVEDGDSAIPLINTLMAQAEASHIPIFISRDWHPQNHCSFVEQGGPWPPHSTQYSKGAEFHPKLILPASFILINKAYQPTLEEYSPFASLATEKGPLKDLIKKLSIERFWIIGFATDYCVQASALDAIKHGFQAHVILAATRAVSLETGKKAIETMQKAGVVLE